VAIPWQSLLTYTDSIIAADISRFAVSHKTLRTGAGVGTCLVRYYHHGDPRDMAAYCRASVARSAAGTVQEVAFRRQLSY